MLSHQLKQFKIDGEKTIIQNPNDAQKKEHERFEFNTHEVYAMDVLVSTGEGVVSNKNSTIYLLGIAVKCSLVVENNDKHVCFLDMLGNYRYAVNRSNDENVSNLREVKYSTG